MGMYDTVIGITRDCEKCGEPLKDWQSKDGECDLKELNYWEVDNFYTSCDVCDTWHEYILKNKRSYIPLSSYDFSTR